MSKTAKKEITDLRKKGARVRGQYFETPFTGYIDHFDIFGNGKGANEIAVGVTFDKPMPIKINGEYSDIREGIHIIAVPDCWAKSPARKRGFNHAKSKCGLNWVEVI